jgi:hypothetical protein
MVDAIRDQKIKRAVAEDDARKAREAVDSRKATAEAWARTWETRERQHCEIRSTGLGKATEDCEKQ